MENSSVQFRDYKLDENKENKDPSQARRKLFSEERAVSTEMYTWPKQMTRFDLVFINNHII